jgi:predicted lipid-binding transport protein (Tim44 family)
MADKTTRAGVTWQTTCKTFGDRKVCYSVPVAAKAKPKRKRAQKKASAKKKSSTPKKSGTAKRRVAAAAARAKKRPVRRDTRTRLKRAKAAPQQLALL